MEKHVYDEKNGLSYTLCGDYYLPDLVLNEEEPTYGKYGMLPYLLIAVYRKDVEKCIQLIKEVLMESQKPWKMVESPLYYRYVDTVQGKSFSGVGNNFVRALATEIENKEEYEFLKGNKELEAIFSQYLK